MFLSSNDSSPAERIPLHTLDKTSPSPEADIVVQTESPPANWTFVARLVGFALSEGVFLAICAICLSNPIILNVRASALSEAKGVATVVVIIWQMATILWIKGIVTDVFSGEWHNHALRSEKMVSNETDKVSRVTTDIWDHLSYMFNKNASYTYRAAFFSWMITLALGGLAPGSISVGAILVNQDEMLEVAMINPNHTLYFGLEYYPQRATFVTRMEQVEKSTFKHPTQKNWIIPTPGDEYLLQRNSSGYIRYATDLVHFDYSCKWEKPQFTGDQHGVILAGGLVWYRQTSSFQSTLLIKDVDAKLDGIVYLSLGSSEENKDGLTAFLFLGSNSTVSPGDNFLYALNLDNLPTELTKTLMPEGTTTPVGSPLAAVLICDPRFNITGGHAMLGSDGFLNVSSFDDARINNINDTITNQIFTLSMLDAITDTEPLRTSPDSINTLTAQLFLSDFAFKNTRPLSAEDITLNMNTYFLSASKAFTDGYSPGDSGFSFAGTFKTVPTTASVQVQKLALIANRRVFFITLGLVGALVLVTPLMFWGWRWSKSYPFGLSSLLRKTSLSSDTPPSETIPLDSSSTVVQVVIAPADWTFPARLIMFIISEGVFLAMASISYTKPIVLDSISTNAISEAKAGSTVLSILWQKVSLVMVQSIIVQIFSGEWHTQILRRRSLTSSIDSVSKLTTGILDHGSHVISSHATHTYRIAFIAWMVSFAISSLAPGTISIDTILVNKYDSSFLVSSVHPDHAWTQGLEYYPRRATSFLRMEQWENTTFRYQVPPKTIIPTPATDYSLLKDRQGEVRYKTDIVQYDYSCSFTAPERFFNETVEQWLVTANGTDWKFMLGAFEAVLVDLPRGSIGVGGIVIPLYNQSTPQSAYLFVAYPKGDAYKDVPFHVDHLPHGNITQMFLPVETHLPPLASVLICDPRYTITGADILLDTNQTLTVLSSGNERVKNIHDDTANVLFSIPLIDALTQIEPFRESFSINTLTSLLFFNGDQPLSAEYIGGRINIFIHSAAKAFTDGYRPIDGKSSFGTFESSTTSAFMEVERLGVVTNRWLFFITIGLTGVVSVLIMLMFTGWRKQKNYPMCIASVMKVKLIPDFVSLTRK